MCCNVFEFIDNVLNFIMWGFLILLIGILFFLYFYNIAVGVQMIRCSFNGQKPSLVNATNWRYEDRRSLLSLGVFVLSLNFILPSIYVSSNLACIMLLVSLIAGYFNFLTSNKEI